MKISVLKYVFLSLVSLNLKAVYASDSLREIEPGVYAGSSIIKGEAVYFGMEALDTTEAIKNWKRFLWHSQSIQDLYRFINKNTGNCSLDSIVNDGKPLKFYTGFSTQDQLDNLVMKFKGLDTQDKRDRGIAINLEYGFTGFTEVMCSQKPSYIVYASTKEVKGKRSFPTRDDGNKFSKLFDEDVEDIIIVVGSWNEPRESHHVENPAFAYENRGIFRNPLNWFQEGKKYAGTSLKLHGFSAFVRKTFHQKDLMVVNAINSMIQVLLKTDWKPGEFILKGKDVTERKAEDSQIFGGDNPCIINVDALIRKFAE